MKRLYPLLFLCALPLCAKELVFECAPWKLMVSDRNGAWIRLQYGSKVVFDNPNHEATVDLNTDVQLVVQKGVETAPNTGGESSANSLSSGKVSRDLKLVSSSFDPKSGNLVLTLRSGIWILEDRITFSERRIHRRAAFMQDSGADVKFRRFFYNQYLPMKGKYLFPGTFFYDTEWRTHNRPTPPVMHPLNRYGDVRKLRGRGNNRVCTAIFEPEKDFSILFFSDTRLDHGRFMYQKKAGILNVQCSFGAQGWALPGQKQELDGVWIEVCSKKADLALRENFPALLKDIGFYRKNRPTWCEDTSIFAIVVEPMRGQKLRSVTEADIPRIKQLGFHTLYIAPVQTGTSRYYPIDYRKIEPNLGTWDDYRAMVALARKNNIRTMQDIVPHGGGQLGALLRGDNISEMLITEQGNILTGWSFDFNNPSWLGKMESVASFYADLGIDAFRVDAIQGGYRPNWRKKGFPSVQPEKQEFEGQQKMLGKCLLPLWQRSIAEHGGIMPALEYPRANLTLNCGGLHMTEAIRRGLQKGNPEGVLLLESDESPFTAAGDMVYDRDIDSLQFKLPQMSAAKFVEGLRLWLDEQKFVDAPGTVRMRYCETYTSDKNTQHIRTGIGANKAIRSLHFVIHGVPMVANFYDYGIGAHLRKLNRLRDRLELLRRGNARYLAVRSSAPEVFPVLRGDEKGFVVAAVSFADRPLQTELSMPRSLTRTVRGKVPWDLFHGRKLAERDGKVQLSLEPWDTAVIGWFAPGVTPEKPEEVYPAAPIVQKGGIPSVTRRNGQITVKNAAYQVVISEKTGLIENFQPRGGVSLESDLLSGAQDLRLNGIKVQGDKIIASYSRKGAKIVYECRPDFVAVRASGMGDDRMVFRIRNSSRYQADLFGGLMDDLTPPEGPVPDFDPEYAQGQRRIRLNDIQLLWNSQEHPLHWKNPELRFLGETGVGLALRFQDPAKLLLKRALGSQSGLFLIAESENGRAPLSFTLNGGAVLQEKTVCGPVPAGKDLTLRNDGFIWEIVSPSYTLKLSRSGVIRELTRMDAQGKKTVLLQDQDVIAQGDLKKRMPYAKVSCDCESIPEFRRENGKLHLVFRGQLRSHYTGEKDVVKTTVSYTLDRDNIRGSFGCLPLRAVKSPQLEWSANLPAGDASFLHWIAGNGNLVPEKKKQKEPQVAWSMFPKDFTLQPLSRYRMEFQIPFSNAPVCKASPAEAPILAVRDDLNFEERSSARSLRTGKTVPIFRPAWRENEFYRTFNTPAFRVGSGIDGSVGLVLKWPNPELFQLLNPVKLAPGKYRFAFSAKTFLIDRPDIREWSRTLLTTQRKHLLTQTPVTVELWYWNGQGKKITARKEFALPKESGWTGYSFDLTVGEEGCAPQIKITAEPEYAGVVVMDNITFTRETGK